MQELSTLGYIIIFSFIGSLLSLLIAAGMLIHKKVAYRLSHYLISFAAGTLLGAVFFDLLPEALHEGEERGIDIFLWTLIGVLFFFLLERCIHWFHHHQEENKERVKPTVALIILGDGVHNFIDGVVIATTFLINIPLGIITTFAIAAHEIPQEIGDFGILLHEGLSRKKALILNMLSAATAMVGAVITFFLGTKLEGVLPIMLSLTAGFFIYIALSDLVPHIHERSHTHKNRWLIFVETGILLLGVITIWIAVTLLEH